MKYQIRAGSLYAVIDGRTAGKLAFVQSPFYTEKQTILSPDGSGKLIAQVRTDGRPGTQGKEYVITDAQEQIVVIGKPMCSEEENSDVDSEIMFPMSRMDTVRLEMNHTVFNLRMRNSQNYCLEDEKGQKKLEMIHNGITGGWTVETEDAIDPLILMGIFLFSRYLDKENQYVVI
ncbi:MAG: hypothetical protein ACFWUC_00535 [Oscillospiraceae bacterium]|jgi:hypothetical protein